MLVVRLRTTAGEPRTPGYCGVWIGAGERVVVIDVLLCGTLAYLYCSRGACGGGGGGGGGDVLLQARSFC